MQNLAAHNKRFGNSGQTTVAVRHMLIAHHRQALNVICNFIETESEQFELNFS